MQGFGVSSQSSGMQKSAMVGNLKQEAAAACSLQHSRPLLGGCTWPVQAFLPAVPGS